MATLKRPASWLTLALAEVGTKEGPGAADNPMVLAYYRDAGHPEVKADEVAWCSAFASAVMARAGYPTPPVAINLLARSWLAYGVACAPRPGAIAIWPRGAAWQGHVGFVVSADLATGTCQLLAGNQGNAVSVQTYGIEHALAFRWPVKATVSALRRAGSTEVKAADKIEAAGIGGVAVAAGGAAAATLMKEPDPGPVAAPSVVDPADLTLIEKAVAAAKAVGGLFVQYPWLAGAVLAGLVLLWVGRRMKQRRVAKAAAGVPISREVV
jgi:uncharacterized protein (TIGR02594 family)